MAGVGIDIKDGATSQSLSGGNITIGARVFGSGNAGGTVGPTTPASASSSGGGGSSGDAPTSPYGYTDPGALIPVTPARSTLETMLKSPAVIFGAFLAVGLALIYIGRKKQ